jgi:phospholipid N-methyltransferase
VLCNDIKWWKISDKTVYMYLKIDKISAFHYIIIFVQYKNVKTKVKQSHLPLHTFPLTDMLKILEEPLSKTCIYDANTIIKYGFWFSLLFQLFYNVFKVFFIRNKYTNRPVNLYQHDDIAFRSSYCI